MESMNVAQILGMIGALVMLIWNIPLIVRVFKRKSSKDISMFWAAGVWICLLLMAPASFVSKDVVWRVFGIINFLFFSLVFAAVLIYRRGN